MDLLTIKKDLKNRFMVFPNEESVKQWIKNNGYTWITKNNKDEVAHKFENYIKSEMQKRIEELQKDLQISINESLEDSIKINAFIESAADGWGAILGGGGAALLTMLVGGAVLWPVAIFTAFVGFFIGKEKMTNDFVRNIYESSKNVCQNACEQISPIIDEMIMKINYLKEIDDSEKLKYKDNIEDEKSKEESFKNIYVIHSIHGKGTISSIENGRIYVQFNQGLKKFLFPEVFIKKNGDCFLDIDDDYENSVNAITFLEKNDLVKLFPKKQVENFVADVDNSWLEECIDRYRLLEFMKKRGFVGFLHTTNFENFKSIFLSKRLLSRNKLESLGISFDDRAESDIILGTDEKVKDCNRFYYRTKTPTNYNAMRWKGQTNPVIFVLKKEFIYDKSAVFYDGNAGSKTINSTKSALVAETFFKWNCIFSEHIPYYDSEETAIFLEKEKCSLDEFRRIKNAEVLFNGELSLDLFEKMYFRTVKDYNNAVELFGREDRFDYDHNMFCY